MSALRPERDLLITAVETNDRHGVGIHLQRLFPDSREFVALRTTSLYQGRESFGAHHHELCSRHLLPAEVEDHLQAILALYRIRRILCVPYYREEFVHGAIARRLTGAPLCTYLMDDQNVYAPHVPDRCVAQLLACSDLRLGISPELCAAYRRKFGAAIHLLPPVVPGGVSLIPNYWRAAPGEPLRAAMIGNIWTDRRLARLRALLRDTGLQVDWYGNGSHASWLTGTAAEWAADGLHCLGHLPDEDLSAALAGYPFVLVPSGDLDEHDDNPAFSRLSLPSRLVFLLTRTDTPLLVLGAPDSAAGRFVNRVGAGLSALHRPPELLAAFAALTHPAHRTAFRAAARAAAPALQMDNTGDWLWRSLAAGAPQPAPFDRLFPPTYAPEPTCAPAVLDPFGPPPTGPFRLEQASGYAYPRRTTLAALLPPPLSAHELNLDRLIEFQSAHLLRGLAPEGDVLFLGPDLPDTLRVAVPRARWWQLRDLDHWIRTGFPGDATQLAPVDPAGGPMHGFPQFAAIVSTDWCGRLAENPHELEGLSLYLAACTRPGGFNLHSFTTLLHPAFLREPPAYGHLRRRFLDPRPWPGLAEFTADPETFFLDEAVYARLWQPNTRQPYAEFGRLLFQTLLWTRPA